MNARTQLVHDLPTRLFHWLFAGTFITAFAIANVAEHSTAFPLHMLAGMLLGALVLFRLLWGLFGTRYARFDSFALRPAQLVEYLHAIFTGGGRRWTGHNPASSWAALLMLGLGAGLAITGLLMVNGGREAYEDVHELLANSFLAVVIAHVTGVIVHSLRHRDAFVKSMLDGRKAGDSESPADVRARPIAAAALTAVIVAFGAYLLRGYDATSGTLSGFGTTLQLGESAGEGQQEHSEEHEDDD